LRASYVDALRSLVDRNRGLRVFSPTRAARSTSLEASGPAPGVLCLLGGGLLALQAVGSTCSAAVVPGVVTIALAEGASIWRRLLRANAAFDGRALPIILLVAALLRAMTVVSPPICRPTVYRYVWDGRVQGAGINPYRYVPADDALASLRDDAIYPNINRSGYAHTIYSAGRR